MKSGLSRTRKITYTAILIALATSLRITKHLLFGPLQFINFPGIFTIVGGIIFGPIMGMTVGFTTYLISDFILGAGPWTIVNALLMGFFGALSGILWRKTNGNFSKIAMGIGVYVIMFAFDVLSSWILNMIFGWPPMIALVYGLLGLFMPNPTGGFMFGVGPITEATTSIVVVTIVALLLKSKIGGRRYQDTPPLGQ
jgi:energy-coupling factor transport system substrate-specific component